MRPPIHGYAPWDFMLAVDAVNYDVAQQLGVARRGTRIINLSSGINLLPPPAYLLDVGAAAINNEAFFHDYDGPAGHEMGRRGVVAYERGRSRGRSAISSKNVLVTTGASTALQAAAAVLRRRLGPGEVVVPAPTYPLAGEILFQAGFRIHEVFSGWSGTRWLPEVERVIAAFTPKTRILYVNQFNNPTGEIYSRGELRALVAACRDRKITLVVDRVSANLDFSDEVPDALAIAEEEEYLERSCLFSSLSKERCVPGLRIGWLIAGAALVTDTERVNGGPAPSSSSPSSAIAHVDLAIRLAAQACDAGGRLEQVAPAAAAAFLDPLEELACLFPAGVALMRAQYETALFRARVDGYLRWREELRQTLQANWASLVSRHPDTIRLGVRPRGGFNAFVRVPGLDRDDPLASTHRLFLETGLQILPAPSFGLTPTEWRRQGFWTRLSYAMPPSRWVEGLDRLNAWVEARTRSAGDQVEEDQPWSSPGPVEHAPAAKGRGGEQLQP
ncbi:MAG: pyridoxal phosphate-dependent aminotransferase [Chloroflexi bacterium]|nr:MAG: pyridoxal phosphate-dependent aminotransferase [Chloroflexota bacterium]